MKEMALFSVRYRYSALDSVIRGERRCELRLRSAAALDEGVFNHERHYRARGDSPLSETGLLLRR